jgi:FKBP-type peptidyl-prolyl cis-trans isomerase
VSTRPLRTTPRQLRAQGTLGTRVVCASLATWLSSVALLPACEPAASREASVAKAVQAPPAPAADAPPPDLKSPPPDAEKTASGLVTKVLKAGRGEERPTARDSVRVQFAGWKASGDLINSSRKDGGPATFALSGVVPGWSEALQLMRVGEQRRLWIPNHLYYDRSGRPPSTVVFDIELLEIIEQETRPAPADAAAAPKDATRTKSGLAYVVLAEGSSDEKPNAWDRVTLSYAGWTSGGEPLDGAEKASFDVSAVMPGWTELLQRMTRGQRVRAWIPEALADAGREGRAAGDVVFELELSSIERRPEPPRAPAHVAAPPKGAKKTRSGLAYQRLARGHGTTHPTEGSRVKLHYSGFTTDGELFDSSVVRGAPKTVPLGSVIAGWREGLQLMVEGDRMLLWIPEHLAYAGAPGAPKGMLVYELELLEIVN